MSDSLRVCVVGAGPAGLCALRYLSEHPGTFDVTAFEQAPVIGGTWVYTEETGVDKHGLPIHSSMYNNITTTIGKYLMAFPDFPFAKDLPTFLNRHTVLSYLQEYGKHYEIEKYIKFETYVECIEPATNERGMLVWKVRVRPLTADNNVNTEYEFDAVMVCNGHYSDPYIPDIAGIETFPGRVMHSHDYRRPELFKDESVVCLGGKQSGHDISVQIAAHADKVYVSISQLKNWLETPPKNVYVNKQILHIDGNIVTFKDETQVEVDTIMLCTGYKFSFPFFPVKHFLPVEAYQHVSTLYKHVIHAKYPSMSVIGLANRINSFPFFACQIRYVISVLNETVLLPSETEMISEIQNEIKEAIVACDNLVYSRIPAKAYHDLSIKQYKYCNDLAELGGFEKLSKVFEAAEKIASHDDGKLEDNELWESISLLNKGI